MQYYSELRSYERIKTVSKEEYDIELDRLRELMEERNNLEIEKGNIVQIRLIEIDTRLYDISGQNGRFRTEAEPSERIVNES